MPVIGKNNPYFDRQTQPRVDMLRGVVGIQVGVDDAALRRDVAGMQGFDGMERAFALLPYRTAQGVEWGHCNLQYEGSHGEMRSGRTIDEHGAYIDGALLDVAAIKRYGVALGLDTNRGTVWLQNKGDNWLKLRLGTGREP